jgi:hypothetical protein
LKYGFTPSLHENGLLNAPRLGKICHADEIIKAVLPFGGCPEWMELI